jgi:hypothetical protein
MFRTVFSERCKKHVTSILEQCNSPLELRNSAESGWGLYASRDIGHLERVLYEKPKIDFDSVSEGEWNLEGRYLAAARGTKFAGTVHQGIFAVASMIDVAMPEMPIKASESIDWLGLGWMEDISGSPICRDDVVISNEDVQIQSEIIQRMFRLPSWSDEEFRLLWSKAQTNIFGSGQLYIATSKFNHTCPFVHRESAFNTAWDPNNTTESLLAQLPMKKGAQACISYAFDPDVHARRAMLKLQYGFECNCQVCKAQLRQIKR